MELTYMEPFLTSAASKDFDDSGLINYSCMVTASLSACCNAMHSLLISCCIIAR